MSAFCNSVKTTDRALPGAQAQAWEGNGKKCYGFAIAFATLLKSRYNPRLYRIPHRDITKTLR
jgi:hypothetical protein